MFILLDSTYLIRRYHPIVKKLGRVLFDRAADVLRTLSSLPVLSSESSQWDRLILVRTKVGWISKGVG